MYEGRHDRAGDQDDKEQKTPQKTYTTNADKHAEMDSKRQLR